MFFTGATVTGSPAAPNEDWIATTPDLVVMLDGATVRTETGCRHGAAWYTRKLGTAIISGASSRSASLPAVLASAINEVAELHPKCNLGHPGTPSAGVAIVRLGDYLLQYLVLGDLTVVLDTTDGLRVISDQRVSATAVAERREADRHSIGSPEKTAAMLAMKHAELTARNRPGGYWISAADPAAVDHAINGELAMRSLRRMALLTDGAARAVDMFRQYPSWQAALDKLSDAGPDAFIKQVRRAESSDQLGVRYPRNKVCDDATAVVVTQALSDDAEPEAGTREQRPLLPRQERLELASDLLNRLNNAYGDGMAQRVRAERRT